MTDPALVDALRKFTNALADAHPGIAATLDQLQRGEIGEQEAMLSLMSLVSGEGLEGDIYRLAESAFGAAREDTTIITTEMDGPSPPVVMQGAGLPRLNPLLEAAIAERIQYDGDAPEFRSGPLPRGASPAVPVDTDARNPVAMGAMLMTASDEVAAQIDDREECIARAAEETALVHQDAQLPARPTGVPGYEAGQVPALRGVEEPSGTALASMSDGEAQEATHRVLSTTQGRRSARKVIEGMLLDGLADEGFKMEARAPGRARSVPVHASWTVDLAGPRGTQANFSFIDVAAKAMLRDLMTQLRERKVIDPVLEVTTIDMADMGKVGWAARVIPREER